MKTETKNYTRVHAEKYSGITTGYKRSILALVNENKSEYFGRWMKVGRIRIMIEPQGENKYKASFKIHRAHGLLGAYDSIHDFIVKLS